MLLVLREFRENLVAALALAERAEHRRGRRENRDREGHEEGDGGEFNPRRRERDQDCGYDGGREGEWEENPGNGDERVSRPGPPLEDPVGGGRRCPLAHRASPTARTHPAE